MLFPQLPEIKELYTSLRIFITNFTYLPGNVSRVKLQPLSIQIEINNGSWITVTIIDNHLMGFYYENYSLKRRITANFNQMNTWCSSIMLNNFYKYSEA